MDKKCPSDIELSLMGTRKAIIPRPPSYSDSFFFLPTNSVPFAILDTDITAQETMFKLGEGEGEDEDGGGVRSYTWIISKCISLCIHITLISVFETVFFFQFISKSEDMALETTMHNYVNGILSQCSTWPQNDTVIISDILAVFINTTLVESNALSAREDRLQFNTQLQLKAWMYVVSLFSAAAGGAIVTKFFKVRINWRNICIENIIMVVLLGLYEFFFFKTIIYDYKSLSLNELNGYILNSLQTVCGLLDS